MIKILDKLFTTETNYSHVKNSIKKLSSKSSIYKIFEAINSFSKDSEVRFVGGVIRKIISKETIDDIDFSTNLSPNEVCSALKHNKIKYYETGISHGTITAIIDDEKFEITSLRKDISTDGRHALVEFSKNWKDDAKRRDFTINAIYSDKEGNLFDPLEGRSDLQKGKINFIGNPEKRIEEDYLRILRYVRFFINYSKFKHDPKILRLIIKNISKITKISSERLLDELKKIFSSDKSLNLFKDKDLSRIINLVFPQLKNFSIFEKPNNYVLENFKKVDFIFLISLLIIDNSDNTEYFIYKFNLSKKEKNRILYLNTFYKKNVDLKYFNEKNLNQIFYFDGLIHLVDIIQFKIFKSQKVDKKLVKLIEIYRDKKLPIMPFGADFLIKKFNLVPGKNLGKKLKHIEAAWVKNNFSISEDQINSIIRD